MNLDESKIQRTSLINIRTVTCPYLKQGRWGHGGSGTQDYCLGYGSKKLRVPTLEERSHFCYSDHFVQCPTYCFVLEEDQRAESLGA